MSQSPAAPLIDFRIRPPFKSFCSNFFVLDYPLDEALPLPAIVRACYREPVPSRDERSMERFLEEMDRAQVSFCVVMGRQDPSTLPAAARKPGVGVANTDVAELVTSHPDRFAGFGGVDTSSVSAALEAIDSLADLGLCGVALDNAMGSPPRHNDDPALEPIYEACRERGLLVCINGSSLLAPDLGYVDPTHIQRVAIRFPELRILVAHACWPFVTQMCAVALQCRNVYLLPDLYPHMPGQQAYFDAVRMGLADQLLFASSYPAMSLPDSAAVFRGLEFSPEGDAHARIFATSARLLSRDPAQLAR